TALQALAGAAQSEEADVRRAALIGLGLARRPEALPLLIAATQSPDPATRLVAISALADASSPHVLPALAKAARDTDESVRAAALGFLASNPSPEATAVLVDLLREPLVDRERLLRMLAMANEGRVAGLLGALETADDEVAKELTSALARIRTPEATTALLSTLSGAAVPARKAAATALASFGTLEATAALRRASETDPDLGVRQICSVLLAQ
ncbi:MAG TPA: HEAT repeat domain-containing protein, partial [Myxococcaceae bacterium]|nr:HEAT repeat domain-containing protein [Myxococcaceae bacterium]